jgi:long-chain acyl-CoA synthetase
MQAVQSLTDLLDGSVERFRHRPLFLRRSQGRWQATSYGEFGDTVARVRAGLAAMGIRPGDRVALIASNSVSWAAIAYATFALGAALVPMYESQREQDWQFIVRDSGAKALFASTRDIFARVSKFPATSPRLEHVLCIEESFAALLQRQGEMTPPPRRPSPAAPAAVLYTSGTTGEPKGVVLSHSNILANVLAIKAIIETTIERPQEHRTLSFLPWAHAFGHTVELHSLIACGASMAIAESLDKVVENIREVRPTVLVAVPLVFVRIHSGIEELVAKRSRVVRWLLRRGVEQASLRREGHRLSLGGRLALLGADRLIFSSIRARFGGRLRFAICGAAALPRETAELIDAIGITVYEGYGLTEASPIVSANTPGARKLGSAGRPLTGVRVVIEKTADAEEEESGEIVVYGENVMQGYHGREDEDRLVLTEGRGLRTGDLGRLDADGFLYVTGRIKEQYKLTNAKYVVPSPLEARLKLSPWIDDIMVYGDGRPYNVALIVPSAPAVLAFAATEGLADVALSALLHHPRVRRQFAAEIQRHSPDFKGYERIRDFTFSPEAFSQEHGTLTPSLKLKRHEIMKRFGHLLERLYAAPCPPQGFTSSSRAGGAA